MFVRERIDTLALYKRELPGLKRRGERLWATCPFHEDRRASFQITLGNLLYYCFGCGVGGDVVDLVMRLRNMSFRDAAIYLGAWAEAVTPDDHQRIARECRERDRARQERED